MKNLLITNVNNQILPKFNNTDISLICLTCSKSKVKTAGHLIFGQLNNIHNILLKKLIEINFNILHDAICYISGCWQSRVVAE